jgi:hypothetical protein
LPPHALHLEHKIEQDFSELSRATSAVHVGLLLVRLQMNHGLGDENWGLATILISILEGQKSLNFP